MGSKTRKIPVINPANAEQLDEVDATPVDELGSIFERSNEAFSEWSCSKVEERLRCLSQLKGAIISRLPEICERITRDVGKPLLESYLHEVFTPCEYAGFFEKNLVSILRPEKIGMGIRRFELRSAEVSRVPYGPSLLIPPPGMPFADTVKKVFSAVLTGGTAVVKSWEECSFTTRLIEELFGDTDFPEGVVQFVYGDRTLDDALLSYPFRIINFVGDIEFGEEVLRRTVGTHPKLFFEFEASNPLVITKDANLDVAVDAAVFGANTNCGQMCSKVDRVLVDKRCFDEVLEKIVERTNALRIGDGMTNVDLGPMRSAEARDRAERCIELAEKAGAKIEVCGEMDGADGEGFFVQPRVLHGAKQIDARLAGPLLWIHPFSEESEIVETISSSPFMRTISLWSRDLDRAQALAKSVRKPGVLINDVLGIADPRLPFGGVGETGSGISHGLHALYEFTYPKHTHLHGRADAKIPFWFPYRALDLERGASFLSGFSSTNFVKRLFSLPKYHPLFKKDD